MTYDLAFSQVNSINTSAVDTSIELGLFVHKLRAGFNRVATTTMQFVAQVATMLPSVDTVGAKESGTSHRVVAKGDIQTARSYIEDGLRYKKLGDTNRNKNNDVASANYHIAVMRYVDGADAYFKIGQQYMDAGKPEKAVEAFEHAVAEFAMARTCLHMATKSTSIDFEQVNADDMAPKFTVEMLNSRAEVVETTFQAAKKLI